MARSPAGRTTDGAAGVPHAQQPSGAEKGQPCAQRTAGQEVQFQAVLENIIDGFIALDRDYRCTYVNKAAATFLNTTADKLIGRPIWEAFASPRYPQLHGEITRAAEQKVYVKFQEYCERCGHWFEWHCYPTDNGLAIFLENVSERKQAEEQVVRSEQHYRLLFETMPEGVVYQDAGGRILSMNPAAERILGRTPTEFLGRTSIDEEHHTLREDGSPFPGLEHPSVVALQTGQEVRNVVMGVFNPRRQAYRWINITAVPLLRPGEDKPYQVYTHFSDITELRQAVRALRGSERRFRKLFEADLMGIFITRLDGTFLDCNQALVKMLGYDSREEVLRHRSSDFYVDPEFRQEAVRMLQKEGVYLGKEGRVWRKDGSIAHLLGAAVLLRDEETGEPYVQGVAVDVTDRRKAEEELRLTEARFRALFRQSPLSIQILSLDGRTVEINQAWEQLWGVMGLTYDLKDWSILHDKQIEAKGLLPYVQRGFAGEATETPVILYDPAEAGFPGRPRWLKAYIYPIKDETGRIIQVVLTHVDVTELVEVGNALRKSEERYRRLFQANLAGVYLIKLDGTILDFNDAMMKMLGYDSREELFQKWTPDFYADPEFRKELIRLLQRDGIVPGQEAVLLKKDGSVLYALGAAVLLTDERTGERYIQGVAVDITERKKAEERLAKNLRDLELLSVSATRYLEAMPSNELFQYTAQQLRAIAGNAVIAVSEYYPSTNQTIVRAVAGPEDKLRKLLTLLGGDPVGLAFTVAEGTRARMARGRLERVEGGLYDLTFYQMPLPLCTLIERELHVGEIYGMPFFLGEDLMGTVAVATDSAEGLRNRELMEAIVNQAALALKRTRTEEALRGSEQALRDLAATLEAQVARRTAELERRARQLQKLMLQLSEAEDRERKRVAEILHDDLQQVLAAAKFHLSLVDNGTRAPEELRQIARGVKQMLSDAIGKARSLSHELSPAVLYQGDLEDTFNWLAQQMQSQYGLTVHVDIRGPIALSSEALRALLYKATQELLFNVVKHARVNAARIRVRRLGRYLGLSVSDRGRGFDPEQLREITGFGLLNIQERVRLLGGRMRIRSAKGKGSTFRIVVPCEELSGAVRGGEPQGQGQAEAGKPVRGRGDGWLRVLLADDHEIVRQGLALLLSEEPGIEVVGQASNGREAVNLTNELRPDVVVMDVSMPLMNGDEATRQIKRHVPGTRVVALSMYEEVETMTKMHEAGAESYVLKTAPSQELLAAIRGKEPVS